MVRDHSRGLTASCCAEEAKEGQASKGGGRGGEGRGLSLLMDYYLYSQKICWYLAEALSL